MLNYSADEVLDLQTPDIEPLTLCILVPKRMRSDFCGEIAPAMQLAG